MSSALEKLSQSLDRDIEKMRYDLKNDISKKRIDISSLEYYTKLDLIAQRRILRRIINVPFELCKEYAEIYISFDELSLLLSKAGLRTREKVEIIMYIFKKNLTTLQNIDISSFDTPLSTYPFKYTTQKEAEKLLSSYKYQKLYKNKDKLTTLEKLKLEEIHKALENSSLNISNIIKQHEIIKEHYFDKYPNLNLEDINYIIGVLKEFNLLPNLLEEINAYFTSLLEKNNKKKKQETKMHNTDVKANTQQVKIPIMSKKEYYNLKKRLNAYYDLDNNIAIRPLSLEEQIMCISLLMTMNISKERIDKILRKINKLSSKHPVALYTRLYKKLSYYKDNEEIKVLLKELDDYFSNMFICRDDDYEILKMCFEDELNKLLELVPNTYDYEYEKAKEMTLSK